MINPVIIEKDGSEKFQEGCLSIPGIYEEVERAKHVKVEYFDREGNKHIIEDNDFLAIAIQHEMDHLDGKVFIEKLSYMKRKKFEKEWKRRIKET
jgi:peptide deformylase